MDYQRFLVVKTQQSTDPNMTIEFMFKMFFDWCILRTMEKSNESSEHERKTIGRFTQSFLEPSLNNCRFQDDQLKTTFRKYKLHRCVTTLPRSQRRSKLPLSDDTKLVRMLRNSPAGQQRHCPQEKSFTLPRAERKIWAALKSTPSRSTEIL